MDDPEIKNTQDLGKVMAILAWVMVLVLLGMFFNYWNKKHHLSNESAIINAQGEPETRITRNIQNQYVVNGTINGKKVTFLIDTGATDVVIPGSVAKDLNLNKGYEGRAHTAGGIVTIYSTVIDELTFGNIKLLKVNASINPKYGGDEVLLGMSALRRLHFVQENDAITLSVRKKK